MSLYNAKTSLAFIVAASIMNGAALASNFSSPTSACQFLSATYGNHTSFPNTTVYTDINTEYWDAGCSLGPACIFSPSTAEQMSVAVKTLSDYNVPFAVKGGGHLAIAGSSKSYCHLFSLSFSTVEY